MVNYSIRFIMGLINSIEPSKEELMHLSWVKGNCMVNKNNQPILLKIFSDKFSIVCGHWNVGNL